MKRFFLILGAASIVMASLSSCAVGRSMKRDCQGGKHVKLKNGVWI